MIALPEPLSTWSQDFELAFQKKIQTFYSDSGQLHEACRYALEGQGKRVRPLLFLAAAHACGLDPYAYFDTAMALEWIHTYSLVHDDLPCMDNDDFRRGRPTVHKVYDEALALLVGDALLSDAFLLLCQQPGASSNSITLLAEAVGSKGMVSGQAWDIYWTAREGYDRHKLDLIHKQKTGALIAASCTLAVSYSHKSQQDRDQLREFGQTLGLTFQIIDDLLDRSASTGKSQGKDEDTGKLTYLSLMSRDAAQAEAKLLTERTMNALADWDESAEPLRQLALILLHRLN